MLVGGPQYRLVSQSCLPAKKLVAPSRASCRVAASCQQVCRPWAASRSGTSALRPELRSFKLDTLLFQLVSHEIGKKVPRRSCGKLCRPVGQARLQGANFVSHRDLTRVTGTPPFAGPDALASRP